MVVERVSWVYVVSCWVRCFVSGLLGVGQLKQVYEPLAKKFASPTTGGDFVFGVDSSGRAFIEEATERGCQRTELVLRPTSDSGA